MRKTGVQIISGGLNGFLRLIVLGSANQTTTVGRDFSLPFSFPAIFRRQIFFVFLLVTLLFSAFGTIYVKDLNRRLMGDLQTMQTTRDNLHNRWSQLLLEESTLDSQARIQVIAKKKLGMVMPRFSKMIEV